METPTKLEHLLDSEGMTIEEICDDCENGTRVGVPGICTNDGCDFTIDYEPDCDSGWCEECETNTVQSVYMLAGIM